MHASLGISGTISANIEEESDGNGPAGQIYSGFSSSCGWRMLSRWEIGPQKNRLANQNKGLAISSVGSNIWHGGGSAIIGCGALTPSMFLAALQVSWRAVSKK